MTELTIPARLVAKGVGLPPVWLSTSGRWMGAGLPSKPWTFYKLDLTNPQTAFGLALKLDEWEFSAGKMTCPSGRGWATTVAINCYAGDTPAGRTFYANLSARLTHIGMDHAIRRALGWGVEPGTLATLQRVAQGWTILSPNGHRNYYSHPDITDPTEALRAIYEEVNNG